jgi:hypothetical protein
MADRRSDAGAKGLATEASCLSTRRKSHPLTIEEKVEQTRLATKRRSVEGAELLADEATRLSAHRKTNPSTVEQKAKNAVLDAVRYRQSRLIVDQKEGKVRIETERRNTEISQAAVVRLLDRRHRYATQFAMVADSVVANASVSNKVLIVQPEYDPVISSARTTRASREVQSDAQQ